MMKKRGKKKEEKKEWMEGRKEKKECSDKEDSLRIRCRLVLMST